MRNGIDLYNIGETTSEVRSALIALREDFDSHIHDGTNSQSFRNLTAESISSLGSLSVRKSNYTDDTGGFWVGLSSNISKLYLGNATNYLKWDGTTLTMSGTLNAATGTLGAITIGTNAWHVDSSGNMWWGNYATYATAYNSIDTNTASSLESLLLHSYEGVKYDFTVGENISTKNTLRVGYDTALEHTYASDTSDDNSLQICNANGLIINVKYTAQPVRYSSVESIKKINLKFVKSGDPKTPFVKVGIQADSGGSPSGTFLADSGYVDIGTGDGIKTFTLTSPYTTTTNTTYWHVLEIQEDGGAPGQYVVGGGVNNSGTVSIRYDGSGTYSLTYLMKTKNSDASSWTDGGLTRNLYFVSTIGETVGRLYKADATSQANVDHYIGLSLEDKSAGSTLQKIATEKLYPYTSLTAGAVYYLSDTPGAIGTSAGTVSKKLGFAIDTASLYLY